MTFRPAMSKWEVLRIFAIGFAIGVICIEIVQVRPILDGWQHTLDGWQGTLNLLSEAASALSGCLDKCGCSSNVTGEPEQYQVFYDVQHS